MAELKGQECPICGKKELVLREDIIEIPHFGKVYVFSAQCEACGYHKSDIEPAEVREPTKYTLDIESEDDLNIRIVKSSQAELKIPHIITIESGPASDGYVTNVEGILQKVKDILNNQKENEDDNVLKNKLKNQIKKLSKVLVGREKLKLIIEDKSGFSAIISDKAKKSKL